MLKALLIGNIGRDPELRYTPDGRPVLQFTVASSYRNRGPDGEWQEKTEWVRVSVFGQRAETLSPYLRKGSKVYVDGQLEARPWIDNQQQPRAGIEIRANDVQFMSSRADDEARAARASADSRGPDELTEGSSPPPQRSSGPRQAQRPSEDTDMDMDDVPF